MHMISLCGKVGRMVVTICKGMSRGKEGHMVVTTCKRGHFVVSRDIWSLPHA